MLGSRVRYRQRKVQWEKKESESWSPAEGVKRGSGHSKTAQLQGTTTHPVEKRVGEFLLRAGIFSVDIVCLTKPDKKVSTMTKK